MTTLLLIYAVLVAALVFSAPPLGTDWVFNMSSAAEDKTTQTGEQHASDTLYALALMGDWSGVYDSLRGSTEAHCEAHSVILLAGVITGDLRPCNSTTSLSEAWADHEVLWLVNSELQYLVRRHGEVATAAYLRTLSDVTAPSSSISPAFDVIRAALTTSRGISPMTGTSLAFLGDAAEMHSRLCVFWDECGDPSASARHHMWFVRAMASLHPHQHPSNFLTLFPRTALSTDPGVESNEQLALYRQTQLLMVEQLASWTEALGNTRDGAFSRLLWRYEQYFTTTPPSMIIGYERSALDLRLVSSVDTLARKIASSIPPYTAALGASVQVEAKVRVAFVSCFFYDHSVSRLVSGLIIALAGSDELEVIVVLITTCTGFTDDWAVQQLRRHVPNFVTLPAKSGPPLGSPDFESSVVASLRSLRLDMVVFPELGMDTTTLALARHRLAPLQLVYWGHPLPQQLASVDYFISSAWFSADSDASPRLEQTLLMTGLSTAFAEPHPPAQEDCAAVMRNLSLPLGTRLVLLPHTVMKFSTEFDQVVLELLRRDPRISVLILYSPSQLLWWQRLSRRLARTAERCTDCHERIIFRRRLPKESYYCLLQESALVLDTFPFGMGVTALEALSLGVPVVTLPTKQTVPALAAGMLRVLGAETLIAATADELVDIAVSVASRGQARATAASQIQLNRMRLFQSPAEVADEWRGMLMALQKSSQMQ